MERIFRNYFWAVNLVFILLIALIAAKTLNLFTEASLTQVPTSAPAQTSARHTPVDIPAGLNLQRLADLTGLPLPKPDPTVTEGPQAAYDPNAAPVKTSLRVRLLGTLDATQSRWSLASIQDMTSQDTATYMVGDKVQGAEIEEIQRDRVIINNNGRREYIDDEAGTGIPVAIAPPIRTSQAVNEPDGNELGQGIKAVDENNYEIPRDTVDNALSNLNTLAMQARIVPAFKDGKSEGFRLFSIRPDSLYSKIGIVNGDVLRRINGFDLNSPEKALEVYQKLKDSSRIDIEIDRNGTLVHKTYNIH